MALPPILGMDLADLGEVLGPDQPVYRARQLYTAIYRGGVSDLQKITTLPAAIRQNLSGREFGLPAIERRYESSDGTRRYLLRLGDGKTVETVLMPEGDRDTICISSQVGCPVDCKFCMTALLGLERNLTAGEIVGQVLVVAQDNGLRTSGDPNGRLNIVMMGQGEPLLNVPNVIKASRILLDPEGFGLSPRRITVSTAGIVPRIAEFGKEAVRPKLAISLNASTEESRQELMPITRKYHLKDLLKACRAGNSVPDALARARRFVPADCAAFGALLRAEAPRARHLRRVRSIEAGQLRSRGCLRPDPDSARELIAGAHAEA